MSRLKTVLLTGASGVVGTALHPALAHHRVISLVHRTRIGAESVTGDVTEPMLGLDKTTYRELISAVDTVVHCAAATDFDTGAAVANRLNVAGTKRILEFAEHASARIVYVSTAFVARGELTRGARGLASETDARPEDYITSKREAEELVRQSAVPAVIARPSVVIGDSTTGAIARFQGAHMVAAGLLRNKFPFIPFAADERVDIIPQDLVAAGLRILVDTDVPSGEYWLSSGPNALTARRFVDICGEVAEEFGISATLPQLIRAETVEQSIRPQLVKTLPQGDIKKLDGLLSLGALFAGAEPFPSSLEMLPGGSIILPSAEWFECAFRASVRFLARAKGLKTAAPGSSDRTMSPDSDPAHGITRTKTVSLEPSQPI